MNNDYNNFKIVIRTNFFQNKTLKLEKFISNRRQSKDLILKLF